MSHSANMIQTYTLFYHSFIYHISSTVRGKHAGISEPRIFVPDFLRLSGVPRIKGRLLTRQNIDGPSLEHVFWGHFRWVEVLGNGTGLLSFAVWTNFLFFQNSDFLIVHEVSHFHVIDLRSQGFSTFMQNSWLSIVGRVSTEIKSICR